MGTHGNWCGSSNWRRHFCAHRRSRQPACRTSVSAILLLAGTGCLFAAFCYAEFASILPVSGSAYAYSYGTVGEFFAWFIGWNLILEYMMGATTVAVSWSKYFVKLLHLVGVQHIPLWLVNDPVSAREAATQAGVQAPAFALTCRRH